jgi:hypothetical protein
MTDKEIIQGFIEIGEMAIAKPEIILEIMRKNDIKFNVPPKNPNDRLIMAVYLELCELAHYHNVMLERIKENER